MSGRRLQEETFQSKVKCTAQVIACSRVYAWVSGCVCICMRSLYASHFGRRRSVVSTLQQMQHPPLTEPSWLQSLSHLRPHCGYSFNQYMCIYWAPSRYLALWYILRLHQWTRMTQSSSSGGSQFKREANERETEIQWGEPSDRGSEGEGKEEEA